MLSEDSGQWTDGRFSHRDHCLGRRRQSGLNETEESNDFEVRLRALSLPISPVLPRDPVHPGPLCFPSPTPSPVALESLWTSWRLS